MNHTEQRAKLAQLQAVCDARDAIRRRIRDDWAAGRIAHIDGTGYDLDKKALDAFPALIEAHLKALDEIELRSRECLAWAIKMRGMEAEIERLKAAGEVLARHGQCASGLFGDLEEYRKARRVFEEATSGT